MSESPNQEEARFRLAAVAGTSTCHLIQVCVTRILWGYSLDSSVRHRKVTLSQAFGVLTRWVMHVWPVGTVIPKALGRL